MDSMLERRSQFTSCIVDEIIYAIGGRQSQQQVSISLASVEYFDVTLRSWKKGAPLPNPVFGHAATVLDNNIYVSGGLAGNHASILSHNSNYSPDHHRENKQRCAKLGCYKQKMGKEGIHDNCKIRTSDGSCEWIHIRITRNYDPNSDNWTRLRPLLHGSFNYGMVAMPVWESARVRREEVERRTGADSQDCFGIRYEERSLERGGPAP
ncbi:hypothetical protein WMY93_029548 [Mugilogobius chulae]|uniref:Uncharacterized protein n=1 Tax=Mugilogobius chulae TaxID=88201 RepID=A0AAW0MPA0_9GOBI